MMMDSASDSTRPASAGGDLDVTFMLFEALLLVLIEQSVLEPDSVSALLDGLLGVVDADNRCASPEVRSKLTRLVNSLNAASARKRRPRPFVRWRSR
jgi:hypothetical protein